MYLRDCHQAEQETVNGRIAELEILAAWVGAKITGSRACELLGIGLVEGRRRVTAVIEAGLKRAMEDTGPESTSDPVERGGK
jgi:hypothetical protein